MKYPKISLPTSMSQNLFKMPPRANVSCPNNTKVANIMVPSCIPKTLFQYQIKKMYKALFIIILKCSLLPIQ